MKSKWEKYFLINHKMILWTVIMILGGGLFGFMVGDWLMPETDGRWMPFGSFMAGLTYLLWRSFMGGILTLPGEYMHAVGMGETRKNFLKVYLGGRTIESLLMFLILLGMAQIESIVCTTWYPGMAGDAEVHGILRPQILLLRSAIHLLLIQETTISTIIQIILPLTSLLQLLLTIRQLTSSHMSRMPRRTLTSTSIWLHC